MALRKQNCVSYQLRFPLKAERKELMKKLIFFCLCFLNVQVANAGLLEAFEVGEKLIVKADLPKVVVGACENGDSRGVVTEHSSANADGTRYTEYIYNCTVTLVNGSSLLKRFPNFFKLYYLLYPNRNDFMKYENDFERERIGDWRETFLVSAGRDKDFSIVVSVWGACYDDYADNCNKAGLLERAEKISIQQKEVESLFSIPTPKY
jgi:hypothetical protein